VVATGDGGWRDEQGDEMRRGSPRGMEGLSRPGLATYSMPGKRETKSGETATPRPEQIRGALSPNRLVVLRRANAGLHTGADAHSPAYFTFLSCPVSPSYHSCGGVARPKPDFSVKLARSERSPGAKKDGLKSSITDKIGAACKWRSNRV